MSKIKAVQVKTVRWQCSGCDHLCAMLLDELTQPTFIVNCPQQKWRKEQSVS